MASARDSIPVPTTVTDEQPIPVITRSQITWLGDRRFDAGPAGRTHRIDGAAKEAPGPVETFLGAICACSSVDVIDILAKRRTPIERLKVDIAADRRPEYPRRVRMLDIHFHIDGAGIDRESAERAIQLSFERYCSIAGSLAGDIVMHTMLTLNGEAFPPVRQAFWTPDAE